MITDIRQLSELDDIAAEAGGYVDYCPDPNAKYGFDSFAFREYCAEKGVDPLDLTIRERNNFIFERKTGKRLDTLPDVGIAYDLRGLSRYSKEKGVEPVDLTIREFQQFIRPASTH